MRGEALKSHATNDVGLLTNEPASIFDQKLALNLRLCLDLSGLVLARLCLEQ